MTNTETPVTVVMTRTGGTATHALDPVTGLTRCGRAAGVVLGTEGEVKTYGTRQTTVDVSCSTCNPRRRMRRR